MLHYSKSEVEQKLAEAKVEYNNLNNRIDKSKGSFRTEQQYHDYKLALREAKSWMNALQRRLNKLNK